MTITEHYFEADGAIIARLGRELVAKQETALIELVKNCYDADATEVIVTFMTDQFPQAIEIRDNGSGMTKAGLVEGFLRLASDKKVSEPISPKFHRRRAGRKGIGRFSTHRLGDVLILTTRSADESSGWKLEVNWTKFHRGTDLSAVPVTISQVDVPEPGTVIRIERLFDEWSDATIKRCWRNILRLQQPFPVAPIKENPVSDPGFLVRFLRESALFRDETVVADLKTEILDHMHAVIEFKVDEEGHANWRMARNRFGPSTEWTPINSFFPESISPPPYKYLKNAWMQTYYAIFLPELWPPLMFSRVRDELAQYGGVRLYRNGFRVVPYGEPDNDWLGFDELYAKRSFLAPVSNRNFFGVLEVQDPEGVMFEEHTSREGLLETQSFAELKHLTSAVIVTAVGAISDSRGKKTRASAPKKLETVGVEKKLRTAIDSLVATAFDRPVELPIANEAKIEVAKIEVATAIENVVLVAQEMQEGVAQAKLQLADETAMLRFLATLGMTTAEFSHETGMTFDAFKIDFDQVFSVAFESKAHDSSFVGRAERARKMLARLDTLTSYLNTLASSRAARDISAVSLSKVVEDFSKGIRLQAETQNIDIKIDVPAYDPLYTMPMHEAEIASLLLNLYTNSVKAMKRSGAVRKILIKCDRDDDDNTVRLKFSDSGDGIPVENRERIFDAFFTTRISSPGLSNEYEHSKGTGLGLWIVAQIVSNANGGVAVIEPEDGFSTTIELSLPKEQENG
jgi:signal transduction histidine kinase